MRKYLKRIIKSAKKHNRNKLFITEIINMRDLEWLKSQNYQVTALITEKNEEYYEISWSNE